MRRLLPAIKLTVNWEKYRPLSMSSVWCYQLQQQLTHA